MRAVCLVAFPTSQSFEQQAELPRPESRKEGNAVLQCFAPRSFFYMRSCQHQKGEKHSITAQVSAHRSAG